MRKYERRANDDSLSKRIKFAKKLFVDKDQDYYYNINK